MGKELLVDERGGKSMGEPTEKRQNTFSHLSFLFPPVTRERKRESRREEPVDATPFPVVFCTSNAGASIALYRLGSAIVGFHLSECLHASDAFRGGPFDAESVPPSSFPFVLSGHRMAHV